MEIVIGFIILILAITIFASSKFGTLAVSKGYASDKARKYTYFIGAVAFFLNVLGQTLLSFSSRDMMALLFCCWGGLVVLIFIAVLNKAYKNMKAAPDANTKFSNESK